MSEEAPERRTKVLDKQRLGTFLLGGAAGILAGILLAPRSGKETRGSVIERAGEARERGRETLFEARERVQERISDAREGQHPSGQHPSGSPPEDPAAARRSYLRDVSRDVEAPPGQAAERSDELRRKVRETRARLKGRLEGPRPVGEDPEEGPDL